MTETILQIYLSEQHIKTDVQENIDNLKKAVKEVITYLTKKKGKADIIPFTLVALDPMVKDSDSVVQLVENLIIKKWPAFKNSVTATKDKSTTYVRAVILESLNQLSKDDGATAAVVWLTARDVIGHYQLGSEDGVIQNFLQDLADKTEENGQAEWRGKISVQSVTFNADKIFTPASINEKQLTQHLKHALVHSDDEGENPHNPVTINGSSYNGYRTDNNSEWGKFAANKTAKGITEVVNLALSQQGNYIHKELQACYALLQTYFENLNYSLGSSLAANNKRSELLWWKQSLYSPLLNTSYRSLNLLDAATAMALDLAGQVGPIYPESVDYLLRETLKDVHGERTEEERLLIEWLNDSSNLHTDIQSGLNEYAVPAEGRKSLLSAWTNVEQSGKATEFFSETGIDKAATLTISDLAVWLFHGLQAHKLATNK